MAGYLGLPGATSAALDPDGWLSTGDLVTIDVGGTLEVVDRLKELIKYKGYQVAPAELQAVLIAHPSVTDAAVVPRPDEEAGEVPVAYVVSPGPLDPQSLLNWVAQRVAPYKRIRAIELIDQIPRGPSGKILRRVLVEEQRAPRVA